MATNQVPIVLVVEDEALICSSWNLIGQLASGGWSVSPV